MTGRTKTAVKARVEAMQARGQYRYDNMPKAEKEAYVAKFGKAPAYDLKAAEKSAAAIRKWAAQAPGQHPYTPPTRG